LTTKEKLVCVSLYPEEARKDKNSEIRLEAYRALGYTEDAKKDKDPDIRLEVYRALGFTEEAKKDENWNIRLEAYRVLGYTEEAKNDKDPDIRQEAELYFKIKNDDMIEIDGKLFSKSTIQEALKQYISKD